MSDALPLNLASAAPAAPPRALTGLTAEAVRVATEAESLRRLWQDPGFRAATGRLTGELDPARIRRQILASALQLSPSMAPDLHRVAHETAGLLGIRAPLELFQSAGAENARIHLVPEPMLIEVQGRLLALLDEDALRAVLGHELGHGLAHGQADGLGARRCAARQLLNDPFVSDELRALARIHSLACELTADRFGLLACQDLAAALRLELVCTTGLAGDTLTWDTDVYLAQCRAHCEALLRDGGMAAGSSHPEHSVRTYALWLFSESDRYRALTGRGPGTRPLAEVDATLERLIGLTPPTGDAALSLFEVPLPELHECALAGAVMVAWADGPPDEAEREAIEAAFSGLVPDWIELLEIEAAEVRFAATAPIMRAAPPGQRQALFHLLTHIMAADGATTSAELGVILGIGQALGRLEEFTAWLTVALERLGLRLDLQTVQPAPLKVSSREAAAALEAFLIGVRRRGGGQVTLRRLLRLLGVPQPTAGSVARLAKALSQAEITATPALDPEALGAEQLDRPLQLQAPPPAAEAPARVVLEGARAELIKALTRLREKLVSGDGRSPAVRLRKTRSGRVFDLFRLDEVKTGQAIRVLSQLQAGRSAALVSADEAGRHGPAHHCVEALTALDRAARDQLEETGAHDLYLGYPVLRGVVGRGAGAYLVRAPLVLHPVDLRRDARGARGYAVAPRPDEEPVVNLSLLRAVFNKLGFALPDSLVDGLHEAAADPAAGPAAVIARLAEVGLDISPPTAALGPFEPLPPDADATAGPLQVEECALLGLFPQSSSDLLHDYDGLLKELLDANRSLGELLSAGEAALPAALRAELAAPEASPEAPEEAPATPARPPVVESDPSQRAVITEARQSRALVVDGPPGTGKSQVIVNLVADALARGERVAVVCEKRAALDVVSQRLTALGLREALAVVHDLNDDRKPLFAQLQARFQGFAPRPFDAEEAAEFAAAAGRATQALAAAGADLARQGPGTGLSYGQLLCLCSGIEAPALPQAARAPLAQLGAGQRAQLERQALRLQAHAPLWRIGGPWRGPAGERWAPLADEAALAALAARIEAARRAAAEAAAAPLPAPLPALRAGAAALAEAQARLADLDADAGARLGACLRRLAADPGALAPLSAAEAAYDGQAEALASVAQPDTVERPLELAPVMGTLARWQGRLWRFFVPGWWAARKALRALLARALPDLAAAPLGASLLETVAHRFDAAEAWRAVQGHAQALDLGPLPEAPAAARAWLGRWQRAAADARALLALRPTLEGAGAWEAPGADGALDGWRARIEAAQARLALDAEARRTAAAARAQLPWLPEDPATAELEALGAALARDGDRLVEIDDLLTGGPTQALGLFDALEAAAPAAPPARWTDALLRAWAQAHVDALEAAHPALARRGAPSDARHLEEHAQELAGLQRTLAEVEVERIRHTLDQAPLLAEAPRAHGARKTPLQAVREELLKEVGKQRRLMPLRAFVRRFAGEGLLDLLPVWLLSPESMAVLFPRAPLFDLVILDEASQCTVEAGFPVLLRARRVVVAGDEHQMPPTSFFQLGEDDGEDLSPDEVAVRDVFASESLLTLTRGRCPHTRLSWHYRCLHESLIAFSNHAIYGGDLQTIPATTTPRAARALRWIAVPDGAYDAGANPPEAARVVALIDQLLAEDPARTLGVVSFNLKQRQAILDAIDTRRASDDGFEARFAAAEALALDARPFVKNLESVQGDERDVIIFSLGHAPQPRMRRGVPTGEYTVPARFGPLGQRGGERRLNVAISRARQACYLVASFAPDQLSVAQATHRGPVLFKQFIEYAHRMDQGRLPEARRILDQARATAASPAAIRQGPLPPEARLAAQIAAALEGHQVPVERGVGTSGFEVPLAVYAPDDPACYRLAVLTDEGAAVGDPFEAHVHQPAVLRMRGWDVLRITAADWARRPEAVLAEILARVPGAAGALDREPWLSHHQGRPAPVPAAAGAQGPSPPGTPSAAWHAEVPAALRPLLAVLEGEGRLTQAQAARLLNARAFDRLRLTLARLRDAGHLPWDFTVSGASEAATLSVAASG